MYGGCTTRPSSTIDDDGKKRRTKRSFASLPEAGTHYCRMPGNEKQAIISKKPYKKKTLKATWDSESESEKEVDTTNMCFMANDNTPKVTSEPSLDDCDLSMDELADAFVELSNNYDF